MAQSPSTVLYQSNDGFTDIAVTPGSPLPVTSTAGGTGALADQVQGNSASGATDVGNPVKIGGTVNNGTPGPYSTGQRADAWMTINGALMVGTDVAAASDAFPNSGIGAFAGRNGSGARPLWVIGSSYNPAGTWDRNRGDSNGQWVKTPLSTGTDRSITVTAASQQLMAANSLRYKFWIKNDTASIQWINFGATAVASAGSGNMAIAANAYYEFTGYNGVVNVIGTAGALSAREFP